MAALPSDLTPVPVPSPAPRPRRRAVQPTPIGIVAPRRHPGRYLVVMLVIAAAGVFGCVSLNALAAEQSFAVRALEADVAELSRTADELTVDVTRLESPDRLHRVATSRLGMVPVDQPAFLVLPRAASDESADSSRTMAAPPASDG